MLNTPLISPLDYWILWSILITWAVLYLFFEQRYKWGSRLSGPVIALVGGLVLSNLGIIPLQSPVYDTVWDYVVPLCIPLLLLKCDLRKIWKETGRMLAAFHLSALGTVIGALLAFVMMGSVVDYIAEVCGIMTASYIGGAMNFLASVYIFNPPESISNALIVADNLVMAVHIMAMLALPGFAFASRWFKSLPDEDLFELDNQKGTGRNGSLDEAVDFWAPKPISIIDLGKNLSLAFIIVTIGTEFSSVFNNSQLVAGFKAGVDNRGLNILLEMIITLVGNKYLLFTAITVGFSFLFPGFSGNLRGTQEMGTFAIYIFFVLIGIPASIKSILLEAPLLLVLCAVIVGANVLVTFTLGRLFGFSLQEMILVSIANTAGPMNSAAIAISKKWNKLVLPAFLVGIWGYVIGTYTGYAMGKVLQILSR